MKKNLSGVGFLLLITFTTSCSSNYFGRFLTRNGTNDPAQVIEECANNGDCEVTNIFNPQPADPGTNPVAIVAVIDTSSSMDNDIEATAEALTTWFTKLQDVGLENFCFAVMLGHAGVNSDMYFSPDPALHPRCMCTTDYSISEMAGQMSYNLTHNVSSDMLADGTSAGTQGGEVNMYAIHKAITDPDVIAANEAAGCFPSEYSLAFVSINDEDDTMATANGTQIPTCAGKFYTGPEAAFAGLDLSTVEFDNSHFPAAVANGGVWNTTDSSSLSYTKTDSQCKEVEARLRWYSNPVPNVDGKYELAITPESIADELRTFNGILPSFISGVGLHQGDTVVDGQAGPYNGVIDLAALFGQTIANIKYTSSDATQPQFEAELNTLAEAMAGVVSFIFGFDLSGTVCPDEIDNIQVFVNGTLVDESDWSLNADHDRITFDSDFDFTFGSVVSVDFNTCG